EREHAGEWHEQIRKRHTVACGVADGSLREMVRPRHEEDGDEQESTERYEEARRIVRGVWRDAVWTVVFCFEDVTRHGVYPPRTRGGKPRAGRASDSASPLGPT